MTDARGRLRRDVELAGLTKHYGDTVALDGLDLVARAGEITGVAGPNGAGKSTMVKILAAEVEADAGEIRLGGILWQEVAAADQVALVHQEPQVFPNLTVAQNLLVGREGSSVVLRSLDESERELLEVLGIGEFANLQLGLLPLAVQQRTEIARALARDVSVFLFDEPNSALTEEESADLFERMHRLAEAEHVVILVSHRLQDLAQHTDRVVIILDGKCSAILEGSDLNEERIARELVVGISPGARIDNGDAPAVADGIEQSLSAHGWTHRSRMFRDVTMHVTAGEIVAVAGVEGSGGRELVRSLAGFEPASGTLTVGGTDVTAGNRAWQRVGFVGADRASNLFGNLSVEENLVVRLSGDIAPRFGAIDRTLSSATARELADRFQVKVASLDEPIGSLSGGNQQKVAIAAAMATHPQALVLEEPTRGVDIGSTREIYRLLQSYAAEGEAIVLFCTEDLEMFEVVDRVYVIARGRVSGEMHIRSYPDIEAFAADRAMLEAGGTTPAREITHDQRGGET